MKTALSTLLLFCVVCAFTECSSGDEVSLLTGIWKMERIESSRGKIIATKPATEEREVIIEFNNANSLDFNGRTPSNRFSGTFQISDGNAELTSYITTYAGERFWGDQFQKNIYQVNRFEFGWEELYLIAEGKRMVFRKIR